MKLYLLSQTENIDYGTYNACVVCAENEDEAKNIMPSYHKGGKPFEVNDRWAFSIEGVNCKYIGEAADGIKKGVVIHSFNGG